MTRDKHRSLEYWENLSSKTLAGLNSFDDYGRYESEMPNSKHAGPLNSLFSTYTYRWIEQVNYRYNRGDTLSLIKSEVIDEGVDRYVTLAYEIDRYRDKMVLPQTYFFDPLIEPHQVQNVYTLLSWLICFDVKVDKLSVLESFIAREGKDRIVDTVLSGFRSSRVIAKACACPRTHRLLESILEAKETKQIALAKQYLERWARLMSTLKGLRALGGAGRAEGAKSNADLPKLAEKNGYQGFWAWDLALLVRVLEIDDSSFADHELYPADLAKFRAS